MTNRRDRPHICVGGSKVHFLQTADAHKYRPLLELTSQTVREYCARHGSTYESFVGIVRGYHPWQASYNRIPLLRRIADTGFRGWVCYLDADAYIADLDFDLTTYLGDKRDVAMILAPGEWGAQWWNVNDGVFLLNLGHPKAGFIVQRWNDLFNDVTDDQLRQRSEWYPENHDQTLLWHTLQSDPDLRESVLIDAERMINYSEGRFIRQALRGNGSMYQRTNLIESEIREILPRPNGEPQPVTGDKAHLAAAEEAFVSAMYGALLLREPNPHEFAAWIDALRAGRCDFASTVLAFLCSPEFRNRFPEFASRYGPPGEPSVE
jgi:hypothetical protein